MTNRRALTLVEFLVVLAIIGGMIGLLMPAVQSARQKAREAVCKNNLHQLNLAVANFAEAHNRFPAQNLPDAVGGWTIEILPYLEESNLEVRVRYGIAVADAPDFLLRSPPIFRCPIRETLDDTQDSMMHPGHYVLVASDRRETYSLYDAPLQISIPWASGPEMAPHTATRLIGPHHEGYFYSRGFQQGVDFVPSNNGAR